MLFSYLQVYTIVCVDLLMLVKQNWGKLVFRFRFMDFV